MQQARKITGDEIGKKSEDKSQIRVLVKTMKVVGVRLKLIRWETMNKNKKRKIAGDKTGKKTEDKSQIRVRIKAMKVVGVKLKQTRWETMNQKPCSKYGPEF